jgi:hypothetical protein
MLCFLLLLVDFGQARPGIRCTVAAECLGEALDDESLCLARQANDARAS